MPESNSVDGKQAEILRRIAAGDRGALADFYDQTAPALFSFALHTLANHQDAEEVIQDVFVQVWTKANAFNPRLGLPFHWIMGITRNRCIDRLRARNRRVRILVEAVENVEMEPADTTTMGPSTLVQEDIIAIRTAVAELPGDQREAIELAFFNGMSHQEIAERLEEPLGTVKARIRRGMMKLRGTLQTQL
jgi:RNA polymerase sigma-70 factor (ECF subfamily)